MSALGQKRTCAAQKGMPALPPTAVHEMAIRDLRSLSVALEPKMSALPPKADIGCRCWNVRFGPIADIKHFHCSLSNQQRIELAVQLTKPPGSLLPMK